MRGVNKDGTITRRFANEINHKFGTVKLPGITRNYIFQEGDLWEDVRDFLDKMHPGWEEYLDS